MKYLLALLFVEYVDEALRLGTFHFRTVHGRLLHHQDDVIRAALEGCLDLCSKSDVSDLSRFCDSLIRSGAPVVVWVVGGRHV